MDTTEKEAKCQEYSGLYEFLFLKNKVSPVGKTGDYNMIFDGCLCRISIRFDTIEAVVSIWALPKCGSYLDDGVEKRFRKKGVPVSESSEEEHALKFLFGGFQPPFNNEYEMRDANGREINEPDLDTLLTGLFLIAQKHIALIQDA